MLFVRVRGGLGNQMFQYAAGTALSLRLQRPLTFDTSWYRRIPPGSTPRVFSLNSFACGRSATFDRSLPRLQGARLAGKVVRKLAGRDSGLLYARVTEANGLFFDHSRLARARVIEMDGYWQGERYFADCAAAVRQGLALADDPSQAARELAQAIDDSESVGVHVRRGDYVTTPSASRRFVACSPQYYLRAAEIVAAAAGRPVFFVFSDDPRWARANVELPHRTVVVSGSARLADHDELWLMSRCRHIITANSTFSWWAAWLSTAAGKVVVAPRRWFADDEEASARILPDSWTAI